MAKRNNKLSKSQIKQQALRRKQSEEKQRFQAEKSKRGQVEQLLKQVADVKGKELSKKQIKEVRKVIGGRITEAGKRSVMELAGYYRQKYQRNSKNKFSAGSAGESFTKRFADTAIACQDLIARISPYRDMSSNVAKAIDIANELINYSTDDTLDYDDVKAENQTDIPKLQNAVKEVLQEIEDSQSEAFPEGEDVEVIKIVLNTEFSEIEALLEELDRLTSDYISNNARPIGI